MAAAAIEIIGLIGSALGILQFGMDNFAEPDTANSVVKIGVGLDTNGGLTNAGGNLPDVRLFNEGGQFLGISADPGDIDDGTTKDIKVYHQGDNGQQSTYALFSANDDAICIAYVSITWPDGNEYAWIGDWGQACGASWYFSHLYIAGTNHQPNCMWIDANGDTPQTGFQVHFPEFVPQESGQLPEGKDLNYFCNSGPPFQLRTDQDPRDITYWVPNNPGKAKRSVTAQAYSPSKKPKFPRRHLNARNETVPIGSGFHNQLVMDNNSNHTTAHLCESENSVGPDFANIADGQFCRMSDKTLWPICDGETTDNCFNLDEQQLVINSVTQRAKKYTNVITWGR